MKFALISVHQTISDGIEPNREDNYQSSTKSSLAGGADLSLYKIPKLRILINWQGELALTDPLITSIDFFQGEGFHFPRLERAVSYFHAQANDVRFG